jgi:uncharacterized membrane protein
MRFNTILGFLLIGIGSLDFIVSIAVAIKMLETRSSSNWLVVVFIIAVGLFLIGSGWARLDSHKKIEEMKEHE